MESLKYTVIKNRKQYNEYCKVLEELIETDQPTKQQDEEILLLTVLIEKWDAEHSHFKTLDPVEIILSLMKEHELKPAGLMQILGISKSYLSEILNYKKGLSKEVIRKLAAQFKMSQETFNRPYPLGVANIDDVASRIKAARNRQANRNIVSRRSVVRGRKGRRLKSA